MNETEQYWIQKHSKRKQNILLLLTKYFKAIKKSKMETLNQRFEIEIKKLNKELYNINQVLESI
tara:strand:- start:28362 stop:28553 length:192 start_codon:yes stop_codon:yes gene_type:complete